MVTTDGTVVIRMGGEAGEGTITIGALFTRTAARLGLEVYTLRTYPSEIKGGQVLFQIRLGTKRVLSEGDAADVLVAMNHQGWEENRADMSAQGVLLYDPGAVEEPEIGGRQAYRIPAGELASEINWRRGKNLVMVGALSWFFRFDLEVTRAVVRQRLGHHPDVLPQNLEALQTGYTYAQEHYPQSFDFHLSLPAQAPERLLLSGADALTLGALEGGCRFYGGYPITPATPVMESLAKYLPAFGGTMVQAEDEIAAINMIIGASFAGQPALTATSGPGLSLMIESLGLASIAEIPVVIVNVQRAGPSTGLPTKMSQGDLFLALYGGHGDAPRFVLAPDSVKDCYYQMVNAFSLAEYYQIPVIVLSDQAMAARVETVPYPEKICGEWNECLERRRPSKKELADDYRRFRESEDGISPMSIPGMEGGIYLAESLEHNEYGYPDQTPKNHQRMMAKRAQKVEAARERLSKWKGAARRWGDKDAKFGIMGWGSTRGAVREAMEQLSQVGIKIETLYPHTLLPMPDAAVKEFIHGKQAIFIPELNYSSQFARMVEHRYYQQLDAGDIHIHMLGKEEGVPFKISEIYEGVLQMIKAERQSWGDKQDAELRAAYQVVQQLSVAEGGTDE
ncbi:MAG TPA: 2-oxoacid:acceptor oxidoreductase subunit alpha [Thermoflexia bacterium]|nr:2-oxoacid:acceptor oxidoreductase subunit alpha [Thermoflexia bacterium]